MSLDALAFRCCWKSRIITAKGGWCLYLPQYQPTSQILWANQHTCTKQSFIFYTFLHLHGLILCSDLRFPRPDNLHPWLGCHQVPGHMVLEAPVLPPPCVACVTLLAICWPCPCRSYLSAGSDYYGHALHLHTSNTVNDLTTRCRCVHYVCSVTLVWPP